LSLVSPASATPASETGLAEGHFYRSTQFFGGNQYGTGLDIRKGEPSGRQRDA